MNMTYFAEFVRDPTLLANFDTALREPGSLTPEQRTQWTCSMSFWFHLAQGNYRQYRRGLLPEESWEPIERGLAGMMQLEGGRQWWAGDALSVAVLADDFRAHVNGLAETGRDDAWIPRAGA